MSDVEQYAAYFTPELKITVCIPMVNNELFREWAIVEMLDEDIITLQLSRDELPVEVHLVAGIMLDLRLGKEGTGFRCGGYFVGELEPGKIVVRLTGSVGTSELREFFRIDAFLPFRYQFTEEQNIDVLIGAWRKRKQNNLAVETERRDEYNEKHREYMFKAASGEFTDKDNKLPDFEEFNPVDETWDTINATAINLSAGGFKFVTSDDFKLDQLVFIEMFLPSDPPHIMESVARVVFKNNNHSFKDDREYFNVAFTFVLIDDRARDAIVSHISHLESLRNRQKHLMPIVDVTSGAKRISPLKMTVYIILLLGILYAVSSYFYDYVNRDVHNEIGDMFQNAVRKYREKTGQKW